MTSTAPDHAGHRPRVEGERELEILAAARRVLADVGYDLLTMDAVAAAARASKATLYRRWHGKADLVVDALAAVKEAAPPADTGSLRGDLTTMFCGDRGLTPDAVDSFASVITALARDPELAATFRERVLAPKLAHTRQAYERARARGEIRADVDLDLLAPALAGIILHRRFVLGVPPDSTTVAAVIDQIILPAALDRTSDRPDQKEDDGQDLD